MLSPRHALLSSVLAGSLFSGLARAEDARGFPNRILFGPTSDSTIDAGMDIEVVWTAVVGDPKPTILDLSTDIQVKVGDYSATHTVQLFVEPGAGACDGNFGAPCGTGWVDGREVELICMSEGSGGCQFPWIKTRFPGISPDLFDESDEIQVVLSPTPGSEPETDASDDLVIESAAGSKFYDRSFDSVELVPVPGTDDLFDVVVEYQVAYNTTMPPQDLRTDIVMNHNGKTFVFQPWCGPWLLSPESDCGDCSNQTCAQIRCGGEIVATLTCQPYENAWGAFGCVCASSPIRFTIPSIQLKAGDHLDLGLRHAPGALPELRRLDRDQWLVCTSEARSATYGEGKAGTFGVPSLDSLAPPVLGELSGIAMKQALPGASVFLFLGFERIEAPFDEGRLLVNPAMIRFLPTPVAADGTLELQALLPDNPALCGASLYYQMMFRDAGAAGRLRLAMTNGLNQVFGW